MMLLGFAGLGFAGYRSTRGLHVAALWQVFWSSGGLDCRLRLTGSVDFGNGSNAFVDATPLVEYAQESGRRNKIAALWSAAAALFTGVTWFVPWIIGWIAHG